MQRLIKTTLAATFIAAGATSAYARCEDGAAIGAGVGALSGILGNKNSGNTVGRTAVGAGLGWVVCNELWKQRQELETDLQGTGATVIDRGDHLVVNFPGGVTFGFGSANLQQNARYAVSQIANSLQKYPNSIVESVGHTDSVGTFEANQTLSDLRASSVKAELARYGVTPSRVRAYGRGELDPIATNSTDYGRSQNRRVEILIIPRNS